MSDKYTPKNEWEQQYQREYNRIIQAINRQKKLGYYVPQEVRPVKPSKVKNVTPENVQELIQLTPQKIRKSSVYIDKTSGEEYEGLDVVKSHHKPKPSTAKIAEPPSPKPRQIKTPTEVKRKKKSGKKQKQTQTTPEPPKPKETQQEDFTPPKPSAPPKENNLNIQIIDKITDMLVNWQPAVYWKSHMKQVKATYRFAIYDKWLQALESEGVYQLAYRLENNAMLYMRMIDRVIHFSDSPQEDSANLSEILTFLTGKTLTKEETDEYASQAYDFIRNTLIGDSFG